DEGREVAIRDGNDRRVEGHMEEETTERPLNLSKYITIWGDGKININTAAHPVLLALSSHLTDQMVQDILRARDQARDDYEKAREEGDTPPPPAGATAGEGQAEEEDRNSFRAADIANV